MWYFMQVTSTEEGITKDGVVAINYNLGPYGTVFNLDEFEDVINSAYDGVHFKLVVEHFCYDDPTMDGYIAGASLFVDESCRHRFRCHFGTKSEVLFKLQTFGILTEELPINDELTLELGWHQEWLATQRKREQGLSTKGFLVPRRFDVLFGRGIDTRVHTGNLRAVHLVEMQYDKYEEASRREKTAIAARIVTQIQESYGRFLKWEEGGWVEEDFDTARNKVSHFFRRKRIAKNDSPNHDL
jgi:hypothetical protein